MVWLIFLRVNHNLISIEDYVPTMTFLIRLQVINLSNGLSALFSFFVLYLFLYPSVYDMHSLTLESIRLMSFLPSMKKKIQMNVWVMVVQALFVDCLFLFLVSFYVYLFMFSNKK